MRTYDVDLEVIKGLGDNGNGHENGNGEQAQGWLVLAGPLPQRWRDRAVSLHLIPLLPQETERIVAGATALPGVTMEDEPLLRVVAEGRKTTAMARELQQPLRTVERRLERLRRLFGVSSTAELTVLLARLGFRQQQPPRPDEQG